MSVGNNIIDASRDLIINVGHNITSPLSRSNITIDSDINTSVFSPAQTSRKEIEEIKPTQIQIPYIVQNLHHPMY
jgi:hypothetical protein